MSLLSGFLVAVQFLCLGFFVWEGTVLNSVLPAVLSVQVIGLGVALWGVVAMKISKY